jgi:hypothetical protein
MEQRAVKLFRKWYKRIDDFAWEFAPDNVAAMATCSACLEILDVEDDVAFDAKYGLKANDREE